jgi:hypothetical protein
MTNVYEKEATVRNLDTSLLTRWLSGREKRGKLSSGRKARVFQRAEIVQVCKLENPSSQRPSLPEIVRLLVVRLLVKQVRIRHLFRMIKDFGPVSVDHVTISRDSQPTFQRFELT